MQQADELEWRVDGLTLRGLGWGPADGHPVLAIHGWLDNALSVEALAQRLPDARVVALDLTGQGQSDYRSADATYNIWDDLPQIVQVIEALGWERLNLMGHSRGAVIATLTAAVLAPRVDRLICLDWMLPPPQPPENTVTQFRQFLSERRARSERTFQDREAYITRRMQRGTTRDIAEALARRGLREEDGAYRLLGDPRLYGASALKLGQDQINAILHALTMPVIWFACDKGQGRQAWGHTLQEQARAILPAFETVTVDGHHHAHMEPQTADIIANHLRSFPG